MAQEKRTTVYSTDPDPLPDKLPSVPLPPNPAAALPSRQGSTPVRVHCERKGRRGKTVSVITGVMSPPAGQEALLKVLKQRLGSGGAIKTETIEIQGDHRQQITVILTELGYRAKPA